MWKGWFSKINLEADLLTEERGWMESTQERGDANGLPPPPPTPGVAKAAAVAEVRSSGTVKVFLRQWEGPRSSGTGVGRWPDSTRTLGKQRGQNENQTKPNFYPGGTWSTPCGQPGGKRPALGWRAPATLTLGDWWGCSSGGLEGECPLRWRVFLQVPEADCPQLMATVDSLVNGDQEGGKGRL